jgi:hypothetical protein
VLSSFREGGDELSIVSVLELNVELASALEASKDESVRGFELGHSHQTSSGLLECISMLPDVECSFIQDQWSSSKGNEPSVLLEVALNSIQDPRIVRYVARHQLVEPISYLIEFIS